MTLSGSAGSAVSSRKTRIREAPLLRFEPGRGPSVGLFWLFGL
jgi:hypothetical protein